MHCFARTLSKIHPVFVLGFQSGFSIRLVDPILPVVFCVPKIHLVFGSGYAILRDWPKERNDMLTSLKRSDRSPWQEVLSASIHHVKFSSARRRITTEGTSVAV